LPFREDHLPAPIETIFLSCTLLATACAGEWYFRVLRASQPEPHPKSWLVPYRLLSLLNNINACGQCSSSLEEYCHTYGVFENALFALSNVRATEVVLSAGTISTSCQYDIWRAINGSCSTPCDEPSEDSCPTIVIMRAPKWSA